MPIDEKYKKNLAKLKNSLDYLLSDKENERYSERRTDEEIEAVNEWLRENHTAKRVLSFPHVVPWLKQPNRYDVRGVDTKHSPKVSKVKR